MKFEKILKRESGVEYAKITYNESDGYISLQWKGFLTVKLVKKGLQKLLEVIQNTKCDKTLIENTNSIGIMSNLADYFEEVWNPAAVKEGLKTMAVIMPDNIFTQISLQGFSNITHGVYTVGIFNNEEEAIKWLKNE